MTLQERVEASAAIVLILMGAFALGLGLGMWLPQSGTEMGVPGCTVLGVVHVNDAPLLYKDCDGRTIREYLHVEGE